jgi:branched-chain amino acid transport system ATP-binding protein
MMLSVRGLTSGYNSSAVLHEINLTVEAGAVLTVVGSNGAGKTTLLRTLSGLLRPMAGQVTLDGVDITHRSPAEIVKLGMAHVPEGRRIFAGLTVEENLLMGGFIVGDKRKFRANLDHVFELFPRLQERRKQVATTLSGGEQQMLAIGRALMTTPKLLLLDEPSMGLAPIVIETLLSSLQALQRSGLCILLVEQNASLALGLADRFMVLTQGRVVKTGLKAGGKSSEELFAAYVGG